MTYVTAEARQQLLDSIAQAIEAISSALASLGAAYEQLDDHSADKLEVELFGPVQAAYGRALRTHAEFADRHGLPRRRFEPASLRIPSTGVKGLLDQAVHAVAEADGALASLQDSMAPVEVGDPPLRSGLAQVRKLLASMSGRTRQFVSLLGR